MHPIQSHAATDAPSAVRQVAAYVVATILLLGFSTYALAALIGAIIVEMPRPSSESSVSRVEQWIRSERDFARLAPAGADRFNGPASLEAPQGPAPDIIVVETEGASVVGATAAIEPIEREELASTRKSQVTYKTVCVRLCDGAYFPLSFATTAKYLAADEALCQSRCGSPARMFYYRNPGQNVASMIDLDGRSYADLKSSFQFHVLYDSRCSCRAQPWDAEAKARHERYAALETSNRARTDIDQRSRNVASEAAVPQPPDSSGQKSGRSESQIALTSAEPWVDVQPRNGEPILVDMTNGRAEAALLSKAKSRSSSKSAQKALAAKAKARLAARDRERLATNVRYASVSPGELVRMHLLGEY